MSQHVPTMHVKLHYIHGTHTHLLQFLTVSQIPCSDNMKTLSPSKLFQLPCVCELIPSKHSL